MVIQWHCVHGGPILNQGTAGCSYWQAPWAVLSSAREAAAVHHKRDGNQRKAGGAFLGRCHGGGCRASLVSHCKCPQLPCTIAERIKLYGAQNAADWVMYRKAPRLRRGGTGLSSGRGCGVHMASRSRRGRLRSGHDHRVLENFRQVQRKPELEDLR